MVPLLHGVTLKKPGLCDTESVMSYSLYNIYSTSLNPSTVSPRRSETHAGDAVALVRMGSPIRRETSRPADSENNWRLGKLYGRMIDYPMLKPHDLCHGVAMEVLEQRHDLEQVRAARACTHRHHANLRDDSPGPTEASGVVLQGNLRGICWRVSEVTRTPCSRNIRMFLNNIRLVVPTGFEPVFKSRRAFAAFSTASRHRPSPHGGLVRERPYRILPVPLLPESHTAEGSVRDRWKSVAGLPHPF